MKDLQTSNVSRRKVLSSAGATAVVGLAGCVGEMPWNEASGAGGDGEISAVAGSFFMLYDLARNVAGEQLAVEDLVPVGAHGDDWEPDPNVMERVAEADVFVYIDGFRGWSDDVAGSLPEDFPEMVVIDAAEGIDYIEGEAGREEDPHFWMDPLKAKDAVENIRDGFVEADPDNGDGYEDNTDALLAELDVVHDAFETIAENRSRDLIVVGSHDSYQYWIPRYGFDIYSPVGIDPDSEPSPQEMDQVRSLVDEHDLDYILYDMYEPTDYAESLAAETDTEILPLSPIEATTEEQLEDGMGYVEHQLDINAETLRKALGVEE